MDKALVHATEGTRRTERSPTTNSYAKQVRDRIKLCKLARRSNCIGTALYVVGEQGEDEFLYRGAYDSYLKKLEVLHSPVKGCLVAWQDPMSDIKAVYHMGIVITTDPILVTHRVGTEGVVIEKQPLSEISILGCTYDCSIFYYLPSALALSVSYPKRD